MSRSIGRTARLATVGAAAAATAALLGMSAGTAAAAPAPQPASPAAVAADCGFTYWYIRSTYVQGYNHCGPTTVRIHVDVRGSGSANDYNLCVGPGLTALSYSVDVLNAYYIGGAGCPKGQRS
jgi:hypothetical protein